MQTIFFIFSVFKIASLSLYWLQMKFSVSLFTGHQQWFSLMHLSPVWWRKETVFYLWRYTFACSHLLRKVWHYFATGHCKSTQTTVKHCFCHTAAETGTWIVTDNYSSRPVWDDKGELCNKGTQHICCTEITCSQWTNWSKCCDHCLPLWPSQPMVWRWATSPPAVSAERWRLSGRFSCERPTTGVIVFCDCCKQLEITTSSLAFLLGDWHEAISTFTEISLL